MFVTYARLPSAVSNSILSLYSTKHINILHFSSNNAFLSHTFWNPLEKQLSLLTTDVKE